MDGLKVRFSAIPLYVLAGTFLLVVLSRAPISPSALSLDNVNLAFAIQSFDPWMHQPQPPGYAFFVAESRVVNFFFRDAERSFFFIATMVTWFSVLMAYVLGRRMFGAAAGAMAALLLIFNPTLWYAGLDSPLRPHLALFSLLIAYCCWRLWHGEHNFALWAAVALGIGGGFRPDLLAYMTPLWFAAMWKAGSSWQSWIRGIGIACLLTIIWMGAAALAVGGLDRYTLLMWVYSFAAMSESSSVLLSTSGSAWLHHVVHMIAWNGVGVLSWLWMVPLWIVARRNQPRQYSRLVFFLSWIVPGMLVQAIVHVGAPGHTLFSVAALCVMGGYVMASTWESLSHQLASRFRIITAGATVAFNVLLFFNAIPFPAARPGQDIYRALFEGVNQTTFEDLRGSNELSESSIRELKELVQSDRPSVIVSTLGSPQHFRFLNSRIASYYIGDRDLWVVGDEENPPRASRIRGKDLLEIRHGGVVRVPVPEGARIIWLMDPSSPFRTAISNAVAMKRDGNLFHSDLVRGVSTFRVANFEFFTERKGEGDRIMIGNRASLVDESRQR